MKSFALLFSLLLLASCATTERSPQGDLAKDGKLKLVFTASQKLQLEPCGCSMGPLGGIKRYWNVLSSWKEKRPGNYVLLTGGTTFIPPEFKPTALSTYQIKAETLITAYNQMGMNVVAPSVADLLLGADKLTALSKKSKAAWVATNWRYKGKALFPTVVKLSYGTGSLWIVGIAKPFSSFSPETAKDVEMLDPKAAIQTVLEEGKADKSSKVVVAITNLPYDENVKLLRETPGLNGIFTAEEHQQSTRPELFGKDKILFRTKDMARVFNILDVNIPANADNFYDPVLGTQFRLAVPRTEKQLAQARKKLKAAKGKAKEKWAADIARMNNELPWYKEVVSRSTPTSITYETTVIHLDALLDHPANPMDRLLDSSKEMVREAAVNSESVY